MSQWEKLMKRILGLSKDLRFEELRKGCRPITIPKHEPIKKVYVELVKQAVESEEKHHEKSE